MRFMGAKRVRMSGDSLPACGDRTHLFILANARHWGIGRRWAPASESEVL